MILLLVLETLLVAANGEPYQASPSSNHHFPPIFYPSTTPAPSLSGVGITTKVPAPHYAAPPLPANLILTPSAGPLHQLPFKQPSDYAAVSPAHPAHQAHTHYNAPSCVGNNYYNTTFTSTWCEEDFEYPVAEIETAIMFHFYSVASMYKEVLYDDESEEYDGESCIRRTNLCPSEVTTIRPRRAMNDKGQWRIIVNRVTADNKGTHFYMTQSARIERCRHHGKSCPVLLDAYRSKCVQKFNYHRFLVFDPYQYYLPFSVDTFRLPSNCNCYTEAYREVTDEEICNVK